VEKTLKPDAPPLALDLIKQYIELEKPEPKKTTSSLAAVSAEQLSQTPVQTVGGLLPPQAPERS
jgi:hypothetical protein